MSKRFISALLTLCIILCTSVPSFATESKILSFDKNGEFKILHLCDCQDGYPAKKEMLTYINYILKIYEPDLVILGGDNTVGPKETKEEAVRELVQPFVENDVYFTLVFGNHDHEQGVDNETILTYFQKHGGKYCLAYDEIPELSGCATHNLPVYSSDGNEIKFNIWMFDSGSYVSDENGTRLGYDCVREDQIEWYKNRSRELEASEGKIVPSMAFQHIVVKEIYDVIFAQANVEIPYITETYDGTTYSVANPITDAFLGHLFEPASPGYFNHGQFDAMVERGDVLAVYSGHDHLNSFEAELNGVKIINTPGASFNAYGNEFVRGSRLITINEDNPYEFKSDVITVNELAYENPDFAAEIGISKFEAFFWIALGEILLFLKGFSAPVSQLIY